MHGESHFSGHEDDEKGSPLRGRLFYFSQSRVAPQRAGSTFNSGVIRRTVTRRFSSDGP